MPWTWEVIPSMFIRLLFAFAFTTTLLYPFTSPPGPNFLADTPAILWAYISMFIMLAILSSLIALIFAITSTIFYLKVPPEQHDLKPFIKLRIVLGVAVGIPLLVLMPFAFQALRDEMTFFQALLICVLSVVAPLKFIHDGYLIKRIKTELYHNPKQSMRTVRAKGFFL